MDKSNSLKGLLELDSGWRAGLILDVRPLESFHRGHLSGAVSHPLGHSCQSDDVPSIILPPRHEPLLVVGEASQQFLELAKQLEGRGRVGVTGLAIDDQDLQSLPVEMIATGSSQKHLWSAPPWLVDHLDLLPPPAAGPVLDLACGSGRAAVFLAEKGYRVTGLDWQREALEMGRWLARSRQVECDFLPADLRDLQAVPSGPWSIILNFRYLQRDLLNLCHGLLLPGGMALVRTFRDAPGYEGHPHPRHRLGAGELLGLFPRGKFQVIAHESGFDADGRPAAGIVARRN